MRHEGAQVAVRKRRPSRAPNLFGSGGLRRTSDSDDSPCSGSEILNMANPQVENGHVRIASEVWDALLKANLGSAEWACLGVVIRKTWGWTKKEAPISLSEFRELTARPVDSVRAALVTLQRKNIVLQTKRPGFQRAAQWSVNKDWETWKGRRGQKSHSPLKIPVSSENTIPEGGENPTPQSLENTTPPPQIAKESPPVQLDAPALKLQTSNLHTITTKRRVGEKAADQCFQAIVDFFFRQFERYRGCPFVAHGADFKELKRLLEQTRGQPAFDQPALEASILRFLASKDPFHLGVGKPMAFWAGSINAFMVPAGRRGHSCDDSDDKPPLVTPCDTCDGSGRVIVAIKNGEDIAAAPWSESRLGMMGPAYGGQEEVRACVCEAGKAFRAVKYAEAAQ